MASLYLTCRLPMIGIWEGEVIEGNADTGIQRANMMPPTNRNEQHFARLEHKLYPGDVPEKRVTIIVRSFAVHPAIDTDMVIYEMGLKRRDKDHFFSTEYLREQNVHRVVMKGRNGSCGAEPKKQLGGGILGIENSIERPNVVQ